MRLLAITSVMALALVSVSWLSGFTQSPGQPPQPLGAPPVTIPQLGAVPQLGVDSSGVQVLSAVFANGVQQLVYVDTKTQTLAVYHVQAGTAKLELKSVRKINHDLALEQFNATEPLPSDMRLLRQ